MRQHTETSLEDPSTDGPRPLLQRVFGHTEPERPEDQYQAGDTVDDRAVDQTQPEDKWDADEQATADREAVDDESRDAAARDDELPDDAVADDVPHSEYQVDGQDDSRRDDDTGAPPGDPEPAAFDEPTRQDPDLEAPGDDEPAADLPAAEPTSVDDPTDFKPGDAPAAAVTEIWSDDSVRDLRDRWREAQLSFVDDPQKAADDIRTLVDEAAEALTAALASQREQLNSWPDNSDTEQYRMVVQRYRTFFERLLAL